MSPQVRTTPWQVTFACIMMFVVATTQATAVLMDISQLGDYAGLVAHAADPQMFFGSTPQEVAVELQFGAMYDTVMATVIFLLALLLFRGERRNFVRIAAVVILGIDLIGMSLALAGFVSDPDPFWSLTAGVIVEVCRFLGFISVVLLWIGAPMRAWIKAGSQA